MLSRTFQSLLVANSGGTWQVMTLNTGCLMCHADPFFNLPRNGPAQGFIPIENCDPDAGGAIAAHFKNIA